MESKKQSVKLRQRKIRNGNISLYLDIYNNGKREYEYLKLYLVTPKNKNDRDNNRKNLDLAENIRSKRQLELKNKEFGITSTFNVNASFIKYYEKLVEEKNSSNGNYGNWKSAMKHFLQFSKKEYTFSEITIGLAEDFKNYLAKDAKTKSESNLSINSQHTYFNKFKATMNSAFNEGLIPTNPILRIKAIKPEDPKREYLTIEELKKLSSTKCKNEVLKRAFLFSCLTGLRWSDVNNLYWKDLVQEDNGFRVIFRQEKTNGLEYLDISEQAKELMGERKEQDDRVFKGLKYSAWNNMELSKWVMRTGITKEITFHCSRHTFAVLQLNLGTDIFTVSKLLGHTHLKTTQIYAKVVDSKKKEAMNRIPNLKI